jgi:hypothetical protein
VLYNEFLKIQHKDNTWYYWSITMKFELESIVQLVDKLFDAKMKK